MEAVAGRVRGGSARRRVVDDRGPPHTHPAGQEVRAGVVDGEDPVGPARPAPLQAGEHRAHVTRQPRQVRRIEVDVAHVVDRLRPLAAGKVQRDRDPHEGHPVVDVGARVDLPRDTAMVEDAQRGSDHPAPVTHQVRDPREACGAADARGARSGAGAVGPGPGADDPLARGQGLLGREALAPAGDHRDGMTTSGEAGGDPARARVELDRGGGDDHQPLGDGRGTHVRPSRAGRVRMPRDPRTARSAGPTPSPSSSARGRP